MSKESLLNISLLRLAYGICFVIITFILSENVFSQNNSFSLTVIVKNQLDENISDAQITLLINNKQTKKLNTNTQGAATFTKVPHGEVVITANSKGFKEYISAPLPIGVETAKVIEISLEVAPIESSIEVDPNQTVDKENYGTRSVITEEEIKNLPDDPVEFERAIRLILGQSITGEDLGITVNGIPKIDLPPKEAIQQIKVDQNVFSAKNSGVGGQGIQVTTKAGMTKFEGNFAFGFSDSRLDARNPFLARRVPYQNKAYKFNLTGPLTKKSSFILSLYRNQRDTNAAINATILNNNFQVESFRQIFFTPRVSNGLELSLNYDPVPKQKIYLNYEYDTSRGIAGVGGFLLPDGVSTSKNQNHSISASHQYFPSANFTSRSILSLNYLRNSSDADGSKPSVVVLDAFTSGSILNQSSSTAYKLRLSNETEHQVGKHNLQYGFEVNTDRRSIISKDNFNGTYLFTGKTAPLLDKNNNPILDASGKVVNEFISSIESYRRNIVFRRLGFSNSEIRQLGGGADQFTISTGNPNLSASQIDYGIYFQNNYKVSERLGIGAGLRYENQTNIRSFSNFSPRLNLIWSPKASKSVAKSLPKISVGTGVYYTRFGIENLIIQRRLSGNDRFSYFVSNSPVLDAFPSVPSINSLEDLSQARSLTFIDPNIRNPFQATFNFAVNKNITKDFSLNFSYTRSNSYRNQVTRNTNAPLAGTYNILVPNSGVYPTGNAGNIYKINSTGESILDRIVVTPKFPRFKIRKHGGYVNTIYSFSKNKSNIVDGSGSSFNAYDFSSEFAPTPLDGIHNLSLLYFQSLPFNSRISLSWNIRSGSRFNIITGRDTNGDGYYLERPGFASDPNKLGVINTSYGLLDPNPSPSDKLIPRNFARGPSVTDTGLGFNKTFGFNKDAKTKKFKQQFSINMSVTNLFNINNKGIPIGNLASPNFLNFLNNSSTLNGGFYSTPRSFNFNLNFDF